MKAIAAVREGWGLFYGVQKLNFGKWALPYTLTIMVTSIGWMAAMFVDWKVCLYLSIGLTASGLLWSVWAVRKAGEWMKLSMARFEKGEPMVVGTPMSIHYFVYLCICVGAQVWFWFIR